MTISAEWAGVIVALLVMIGGVVAYLLNAVRQQIRELRQSVDNDKAAQQRTYEALDARLRRHTEDENRHITVAWLTESVQWRRDLVARFERFEERVYDLLNKARP